eukprot:scaffold36722_cov168-Amphora_coffeaeformis.AAC.1
MVVEKEKQSAAPELGHIFWSNLTAILETVLKTIGGGPGCRWCRREDNRYSCRLLEPGTTTTEAAATAGGGGCRSGRAPSVDRRIESSRRQKKHEQKHSCPRVQLLGPHFLLDYTMAVVEEEEVNAAIYDFGYGMLEQEDHCVWWRIVGVKDLGHPHNNNVDDNNMC